MKAVVVEQYAPIDQIGLREIATPEPGPGQIRVQVHAASIGFVDGLKVEGRYQTKDALPFTPGAEFAGVVDAVAGDVAGIAPGMALISATTASPGSASRSLTTTRAPSLASFSAIARPMPRPDPETSATFPFSFDIISPTAR